MYSKPERVKDSPRALTNSSGTGAVPLHRQPGSQRRRRRFPQRQASFPSALAMDEHIGLGLKLQIIKAEADQFGDAQSAGVAQVQHGAVADAGPRGWVGCIQNGLHFLDASDAGPDATRFSWRESPGCAGSAPCADGTRYSMKCMKDLIAASRTFRELGPLPRVVSKSFRKSTTSGASICSSANWDGATLRRLLA